MIALGCDHGGYPLMQEIKAYLNAHKIPFKDFGTYSADSCDYPDFAAAACTAVQDGTCEKALLCCGTGIGISMAANKFRGIRAACCSDYFSAKYTRLHNNANVLCMGGRVIGPGLACELVNVFLHTDYEGGERHERRLHKITEIEKKQARGKQS